MTLEQPLGVVRRNWQLNGARPLPPAVHGNLKQRRSTGGCIDLDHGYPTILLYVNTVLRSVRPPLTQSLVRELAWWPEHLDPELGGDLDQLGDSILARALGAVGKPKQVGAAASE